MKLKNVMFGIVGGLFVLTVATISCSKSSTPGAPPSTAPTVSGVTVGGTDTVGKTASITITGANLTGATVTTTTSGVTISNVVVAAGGGSLTATIVVASTVTPGTVTLTITTSTSPAATTTITVVAASGPFSIDGFTSSNQVAASNLKAYWPFDNSSSEEFISTEVGKTIAGGANMNGTVTYTTGQIGGAVKFTDGALIYPPIPNLDSINQLQRYTISMWVNMSGSNASEYSNPSVGEFGKESSLFQVNGDFYNDIWGLCAVDVKTNGTYGADTLAVGGEITQIDGNAPYVHTDDTSAVLYPRTNPNQYVPGNTWTFITETFDDGAAAGWTLKIYDNGKLLDSAILNPALYMTAGETFTLNPFSPQGANYGANQVTFGSYDFGDDFNAGNPYSANAPYGFPGLAATKAYWARGINGMLDDARVFNVVLSQGQINDLYQLGLHGE
jgi:hypothetical protein